MDVPCDGLENMFLGIARQSLQVITSENIQKIDWLFRADHPKFMPTWPLRSGPY